MWTEISKDLVVKEAIQHMGYEYEDTPMFFYVMSYLRYVCLVRDRHEINEIDRDSRTMYFSWSSYLTTSADSARTEFARSSGSAIGKMIGTDGIAIITIITTSLGTTKELGKEKSFTTTAGRGTTEDVSRHYDLRPYDRPHMADFELQF
jgi:hypothetical protein